jgi:hypothetical protein
MSDERNRFLLEWLEDKALLGQWISSVEILVQDMEDSERKLENIRNVAISLLEKLQVVEERALRMLPSLM